MRYNAKKHTQHNDENKHKQSKVTQVSKEVRPPRRTDFYEIRRTPGRKQAAYNASRRGFHPRRSKQTIHPAKYHTDFQTLGPGNYHAF